MLDQFGVVIAQEIAQLLDDHSGGLDVVIEVFDIELNVLVWINNAHFWISLANGKYGNGAFIKRRIVKRSAAVNANALVVDRLAEIQAKHLPLLPFGAATDKALVALSPATADQLAALGIVLPRDPTRPKAPLKAHAARLRYSCRRVAIAVSPWCDAP
jgi:hypothetical protein